jgi:toxin ParE1/3/4
MRATFSSRAKSDIQEIWNYTVEHWGKGQAEIYLRLIGAAVASIAADPKVGRPSDEVRPGYRKYLVGSHVLFYRATDKAIFVVRILHQRMDFERHL